MQNAGLRRENCGLSYFVFLHLLSSPYLYTLCLQWLVGNLRNSGYWHRRHDCRFTLVLFTRAVVVVVCCGWLCPLLFLLSSMYVWSACWSSPLLSLSSVLVVVLVLVILVVCGRRHSPAFVLAILAFVTGVLTITNVTIGCVSIYCSTSSV